MFTTEENNQSEFKGRIVDGNGEPLSGVNVAIKTDITKLREISAVFDYVNESTTTDSNGEWKIIIPTTNIDIKNIYITFNKDNYDFKKITNPLQTSDVIGMLDIPLDEPVPIEYLSKSTQNLFEQYKNDNTLLLIRDGRIEAGHPFAEKGSGGRTLGTLYYKGKFLSLCIEDIVRFDQKVKNETAIPAGEYYVNLDTTSNKHLYGQYVELYGKDEYPAKWSKDKIRGVFPRVGDNGPDAYFVNKDKNFYFGGSRIHAGISENNSEGCIIVTLARKKDGFLIPDQRKRSHQITKLVYDNNITKLFIINDFNLRTLKKQSK